MLMRWPCLIDGRHQHYQLSFWDSNEHLNLSDKPSSFHFPSQYSQPRRITIVKFIMKILSQLVDKDCYFLAYRTCFSCVDLYFLTPVQWCICPNAQPHGMVCFLHPGAVSQNPPPPQGRAGLRGPPFCSAAGVRRPVAVYFHRFLFFITFLKPILRKGVWCVHFWVLHVWTASFCYHGDFYSYRQDGACTNSSPGPASTQRALARPDAMLTASPCVHLPASSRASSSSAPSSPLPAALKLGIEVLDLGVLFNYSGEELSGHWDVLVWRRMSFGSKTSCYFFDICLHFCPVLSLEVIRRILNT